MLLQQLRKNMTFLSTKKAKVITGNSMISNGTGILVTEEGNIQQTLLLESDMNDSVKNKICRKSGALQKLNI